MKRRHIAPDLFEETSAGPRLVGGRNKTDGRVVFPLPGGSERELYERMLLGSKGTLWGWTVQRFRPGSPPYAGAGKDDFRPFVVGFLSIPDEVIVEGYIEAEPDTLRVGQPMELTTRVFSTNADGTEVTIYAFRPTI
ncbi:hypothetical protein ACG33_11355 [Steroidobacter denitrificans]|uniref:ChsH2 C-terminal OB-fold domain-containing protein n=2 Tax=Steroidobacter denitrificans TaxID=465721 RepID=A0A127FDH2_STEDE|nr:hypothetical protein ACG33_11355 [Steroidobacter denitrificans]